MHRRRGFRLWLLLLRNQARPLFYLYCLGWGYSDLWWRRVLLALVVLRLWYCGLQTLYRLLIPSRSLLLLL